MNEKLWKNVINGYTNVQLYKDKLKDNNLAIEDMENIKWEDIPLADKYDYIAASREYGIAKNHVADFFDKKVIGSFTSGSTGTCVCSFIKYENAKKSLMELWILRKKRYNIASSDRLCYFYSTRDDNEVLKENILLKEKLHELSFNKNRFNSENNIEKICYMISSYNPSWMILQPSIAVVMADMVHKKNIEFKSLKYIELTGELLKDSVRKRLEEVFNCSIANQYGINEVGTIAYECKNGNMHLMDSNVYAEVIRDGRIAEENEEGEIHITSLNNDIMPFIRYNTGDIGTITNAKCSCGCTKKVLKITKGRTMDFVLHEDGRRTSAYVFMEAIEETNRLTERAIRQYNVEQLSLEEVLIKLVMSEDTDEDEVCDLVLDNLSEEITDDLNVNFEIYNYLFPEEKTGKLSFFKRCF